MLSTTPLEQFELIEVEEYRYEGEWARPRTGTLQTYQTVYGEMYIARKGRFKSRTETSRYDAMEWLDSQMSYCMLERVFLSGKIIFPAPTKKPPPA